LQQSVEGAAGGEADDVLGEECDVTQRSGFVVRREDGKQVGVADV
jgi:hypothetical protein